MIAPLMFIGYFLGSIPVAWVAARLLTGEDLRKLGSGNVGVMNVAVSVSRWAGALVFLAEAAKGFAAVLVARMLDGSDLAIIITVLMTVAGTRWPIWLSFRGGRGNSAGGAALLIISWQTLFIALVLWGLVRLITGSSFYATRLNLLLMPLVLGLISQSWLFMLLGGALSLMYLTTHEKSSDDHLIIRERWSSLWSFLTGPPRR